MPLPSRLQSRSSYAHARLAVSLLLYGLLAAWTFTGAWRWLDKPFPGFVINPTLSTDAVLMAEWTGARAGVRSFDQILSFEGHPPRSSAEIFAAVRAKPAGTRFHYRMQQAGERPRALVVPSATFTTWDFTSFFLGFWLAGLAHLLLGAWVLYLRPDHPAARAHWLVCQALGFFLLTNFETTDTGYCYFPMIAAGFLLAPAFTSLAAVFPQPLGTPRARRRVVQASWLFAVAGSVVSLVLLRRSNGDPSLENLVLVPPASCVCLAVAIWAWQASSRRFTRDVRARAQVVMLGLSAAFLPAVLCTVFTPVLGHPLPYSQILNLLFALFPASVAYAIVRHGAFDIQFVVRRATLYLTALAALAGIYAAVAGNVWRLFGSQASSGWPGLLAAIAVALAFGPLVERLRRRIDRLFLGPRADVLGMLASFQPPADADVANITQAVGRLVEQAVLPAWLRLEPVAPEGKDAVADEAELRLPLVAAGVSQGELVLGPRRDGRPYATDERRLLAVLADRAAVALSNARLQEERLALRVREAVSSTMAAERRELLLQVVHDLRSDLTSVAIAADLAKQRPDDERLWQQVERATRRMEGFLAEKVRVLDAGPSNPGSLLAALADAEASVGPQCERKRQRLQVSRPDGDVMLPVGTVAFAQVLANLLGNASKFAPLDTTVRCEVDVGPAGLRLVVEDEGPGIPSELLTTLGTGRRAHPDIPGQGLGLVNVRTLLAPVGGQLSWGNRERGARVEVWLPLPEGPRGG